MRFVYGKQEMRSLSRSQESCFLLTNGLGGYASLTAAYSANRCDQGVLIAAQKAPGERVTLVHRLRETLTLLALHPAVCRRHHAGGWLPQPQLLRI